MKTVKINFLAALAFIVTATVSAQHDYDSQGMIYSKDGKVSIGNKSPRSNFGVYSWDGRTTLGVVTNQYSGMAILEIAGGIAKDGAGYKGWKLVHSNNHTGNKLYFSYGKSTANNKMTLSPEGNLGISGKFEAKQVKISKTPTADFVFEEDYALPELAKVEAFITKNKHLPEIASAKEMEANGVNVGEFQIQLLQKIEELTLYTIKQQKQIEALQQQVVGNK